MENFIHEQSMAIFKRLLTEAPDMDQERRKLILRLLAEAEANEHRCTQLRPARAQTHRVQLSRGT
jgi:hypothetical protein